MDLSPITSLGIIDDPTRCPPNFDVVLRSADRREDGDLWRDGLFRNKVTRYLCFSRTPSKHRDSEQLLLTEICILNEKDAIPDGFVTIEKTLDTMERAIKKKLLCVRYEMRNKTTEAICDIILLSKAKRAPPLHVLVGEINGLVVCYKTCAVTSSSAVPDVPEEEEHHEEVPVPCYNTGTLFVNAMYGVPFQLNSSLTQNNETLDFRDLQRKYADPAEVSNEFDYSFVLENSLTQQVL